MPLILSTAGPSDLPGIVAAQYAAFHPQDTLHRLIYPSPHPVPAHVIERTIARQLKTMDDPNTTWLKITDPSTDGIVAAAKWIIWPPVPSPLLGAGSQTDDASAKRWPDKVDVTWILPSEAGLNAGAGTDDLPYVSWVTEELYARRREHIQGAAALLDICFCAPSHHRRGAGRQLVEWGTRRADELGVNAFVEASLAGRKLYESCGFGIVEDVALEGARVREAWREYGVLEYKFMVRKNREAKH